ncbi:hypothetical protein [Mycobacteroides abscessus]|uniref:hypothetical protein n=1 Tax=Mycobacteroides abscessus TaxID=36809 RepID=UPI0009A56AD8|nr:hypothetical protein [Mycobacteroides abscessus]SKQ75383.1 Uncharacterised protein [Mycobacteroides abscessus subsp. massiliense]
MNLYDDAVGNLLLRPLRLWVMYLPQLAACYLLGLLGRNIVIELAAKYAWNNYLVVDLLMPFAGLARLGSIIAMFLVLRSAIPALAAMPKISLRNVDIFANIVLPFFVIYLAWKMFQDDWLTYEQKAMWHRVGAHMTTGTRVVNLGDVPVTNYVWVLIAGAFVLRMLLNLKAIKHRLPGWFVFIRVYLDALWVFLVLSFSASKGVNFFLSPSAWFKERRIVVWLDEMRSELFSHFRPLEVLWTFVSDAWQIIWGAAAVPLIWLAIAGIVYGSSSNASWRGVLRRLAGVDGQVVADRLAPTREQVQRRVAGRVSEQTRDKAKDWLLSQFGSAKPIVDSARLVLHGGLILLSAYVLVYLCLAWLDMSDSFLTTQMQVGGYLTRGFAWVLGPHPLSFWNGVAPVLTAISGVLVASLRVCVITSVFAHCVEKAEAEAAALHDNEVVDYPADSDDALAVNPVIADR